MGVDIKKILVPIDYSENAYVAKEYADAQAQAFNAEVNLLHVVDNTSYDSYLQKGMMGEGMIPIPVEDVLPDSEMGKRIKTFLDKAQAELEKYAQGGPIPHKTTLRHGPVVDTILAEIESYKPDLVVMATHGLSGLMHMMLGSVTEKVVRLSPVPVLTTRMK